MKAQFRVSAGAIRSAPSIVSIPVPWANAQLNVSLICHFDLGLKQVYAQLIFSGYDTSRFTANSVSFSMADDVTRDLVVYLQSISYSGSSSAILLSDPILIFIDSTDPNLWLPEGVCDAFEQAFGLTLDSESGLYLVNDTHNTELLNSNAQVTFRLSDVASGGDAVTVTLPYDAFALTAQAPLVDNSSYYFPLKRAANSTQYTLGRAFLQEAWVHNASTPEHTLTSSDISQPITSEASSMYRHALGMKTRRNTSSLSVPKILTPLARETHARPLEVVPTILRP